MKKNNPSKEEGRVQTMLQLRVVLQDKQGSVRDVTHDDEGDGYGLGDLQERSCNASDCLSRVRELLQLLALASENREQVATTLVQRVLEEVDMNLEDMGDLGHYVRYTQGLFENAMALPRISGIRPEVFQHRSPLKAVS